jgi:hypothetical protein
MMVSLGSSKNSRFKRSHKQLLVNPSSAFLTVTAVSRKSLSKKKIKG